MKKPALLDPNRLLEGVEYKVYRGMDGTWHGHVTGLRRGDVDGLLMRSTSISSYGIATAPRPSDRNQFPVRLVMPDSGPPWVDVGFCSTEDEARDRVCEVIGYVLGRRLYKDTAGYTPKPEAVPAVREGTFS
jgi:hypothetical protein